jgi:hypothetical protein
VRGILIFVTEGDNNMKKFSKSAILILVFIFVLSCTSDEDSEKYDGPPDDWDYGNVVGDDDAQAPDSDIAKTDEEAVFSDDEASSDDDSQKNDKDPIEIEKGCGNETVEYNERCDSPIPVECKNLNPNMDGIAYCSHDCLSYDLSQCSLKKDIWGIANVRFNTNFILDAQKISDPSYFQKGTQPYAAFGALYDKNKQVPSPNERSFVSFAFTTNYQATFGTKRQLFLKQYPVVSGQPGYPRLELEFAPGGMKNGSEYRINAVRTIEFIDNLLKLVRFRLVEKQDGAECIMGLGYSGSVYITEVFPQNAELWDGGAIEVVANNVIFYHPDKIEEIGGEPIPEEVLNLPICSL